MHTLYFNSICVPFQLKQILAIDLLTRISFFSRQHATPNSNTQRWRSYLLIYCNGHCVFRPAFLPNLPAQPKAERCAKLKVLELFAMFEESLGPTPSGVRCFQLQSPTRHLRRTYLNNWDFLFLFFILIPPILAKPQSSQDPTAHSGFPWVSGFPWTSDDFAAAIHR